MLSQGVNIELVFGDETGSVSAMSVHVPFSSTYAQADVAASAVASALVSITGCVLLRQRIKYYVVRDNPTPAAIDSSLMRRAVFFFNTSDTTPFALVEIPSPLEDIFLTSGFGAGIVVDLSNTDVTAFTDEIIALGVVNPFGDVVTSVDTAYLQSRV